MTLSQDTWEALQELRKNQNKSLDSLLDEALRNYMSRQTSSPDGVPASKPATGRPQGAYKPQTHLRQAAVVPGEAAVLFIDVQNYNCHPEGSEAKELGHVSTAALPRTMPFLSYFMFVPHKFHAF